MAAPYGCLRAAGRSSYLSLPSLWSGTRLDLSLLSWEYVSCCSYFSLVAGQTEAPAFHPLEAVRICP